MSNKKYDQFYKWILIGIAVLSLTGTVGTYIKPVFISRLEAVELKVISQDLQLTRMEEKIDKIIWKLK